MRRGGFWHQVAFVALTVTDEPRPGGCRAINPCSPTAAVALIAFWLSNVAACFSRLADTSEPCLRCKANSKFGLQVWQEVSNPPWRGRTIDDRWMADDKVPYTQTAGPIKNIIQPTIHVLIHSLSPGIKISVGGLLIGPKTDIGLSLCKFLPATASGMIGFVAETESSASCR
jgi:hypothetical protein